MEAVKDAASPDADADADAAKDTISLAQKARPRKVYANT